MRVVNASVVASFLLASKSEGFTAIRKQQKWISESSFSMNGENPLKPCAMEMAKLSDADIQAENEPVLLSRRSALATLMFAPTLALVGSMNAFAAENEEDETLTQPPPPKSLATNLYYILRVREATYQETRLIKSGKFKDVQRANVKLAIRFMINNYRLNDNVIAASAYLDGGSKRIEAGNIGQSAVQNLQTILEYFDSSDVQNLKVGSLDNMAGKEGLVLNGLEAAKKNIDAFLAYFPKEELEAVVAKIKEENALNEKEFDPELGTIVNLAPKKS